MCRVILDVNHEFGRPSRSSNTHGRGHGHLRPGWWCSTTAARSPRPPPSPEGPGRLDAYWACACVSIEGAPSLMLDVLHAVLVAPFKDMAGAPAFLVEVLIGAFSPAHVLLLARVRAHLQGLGVFNFARA